jgi:non-ribosomal peptide synthetase component F
MLTFQNFAPTRFELPGLTLSAVEADAHLAKFDLQVTMVEQDDKWLVALGYATDLFDGSTMASFAERFERLLTGLVVDPSLSVGDVDFVTAEERERVLSAWTVPGVETDTSTTLPMLFERAARAWPENIAAVAGETSLDYAGLSARANRLARKLIDSGVRPGSLVGVALPRDESLVVTLLAVVTAGAAYLPVDVTAPKSRISYILEDGAPTVVVTSSGQVQDLPQMGRTEVLVLDDLSLGEFSPAEVTDSDRLMPLRSSDLAYVIYTSGSTGRPKGVAVTHRNVVELIDNAQSKFGFDESDVWTMFHSYAFDF